MPLADLDKLEARLRKAPNDANLQIEIGARSREPTRARTPARYAPAGGRCARQALARSAPRRAPEFGLLWCVPGAGARVPPAPRSLACPRVQ